MDRCPIGGGAPSRVGAVALAAACALALRTPAQGLPTWVITAEAKPELRELWAQSVADHRERVGCIGGTIGGDTVRVERVRLLDAGAADSLTASAELSLGTCGPPEWIGTVHTHVRATDDTVPAPRFSAGDRTVMSLWSRRWARQGAFCVLYSERHAHCELYPPRLSRPGEP